MRRRGIIATTLVIASSGCAAGGSVASPDTTQTTSPFVDQVGVPVHANANNGATADITLNSVSWLPDTCNGGGGAERNSCAVLELTFAGTSPTPFKYNESFVTAAYSSGPFNRWGGSTGVNYTAINKLPPLRLGSVSAGQTAHGFVPSASAARVTGTSK
jgi:hypothetical protein